MTLDDSACATCASDGGVGDGVAATVEGGCGCRAAGGGAPNPGWILVLLLALGWRRRRLAGR